MVDMNITKIYDLEPKESKILQEHNKTIITAMQNIITSQYRQQFYYNAEKHLKNSVEILMHPFNQSYLKNTILSFELLDFLVNLFISQGDYSKHGLTCGVNSSHDILMPRIDSSGNKYLICPTCGYIQKL